MSGSVDGSGGAGVPERGAPPCAGRLNTLRNTQQRFSTGP